MFNLSFWQKSIRKMIAGFAEYEEGKEEKRLQGHNKEKF